MAWFKAIARKNRLSYPKKGLSSVVKVIYYFKGLFRGVN